MIHERQTPVSAEMVEQALREQLAEGDAVITSTRPILRHLLANRDQSLFSDEVVARVRGMIDHLARQLLLATLDPATADPLRAVEAAQDELARQLLDDVAFLSHAHALVLENQLTEQLQRRSGIDGVLSPLVQEQAASTDAQVATAAMRVIAAQARFLQQVRRMELPLTELPGELFHKAMVYLVNQPDLGGRIEQAEKRLRAEFDEGMSRLGQLNRLVMALGSRATRALALDHGGLALFVTALAMASRQDRDLAVLSLGESQFARLALSLRAAGLTEASVEEQFLYLHPDAVLPAGFAQVPAQKAADLLDAMAQASGA